jgi:hypothetical protein
MRMRFILVGYFVMVFQFVMYLLWTRLYRTETDTSLTRFLVAHDMIMNVYEIIDEAWTWRSG